MKLGAAVLCVLWFAASQVRAEQEFTDHATFFDYVARTEQASLVFVRRPLGAATPVDHDVAVEGLARRWGPVRLARDAVTLNGKRFTWSGAKRVWGRPAQVAMDIEIAQVWEQPGQPRICVQSAAGRSGSGARWQHVVVIERATRQAKPRLLTWTSPYGSCQAVFADDRNRVIAGTFEMSFESESAISAAAFSLRSLSSGEQTARYKLTLHDPGNAFAFAAEKLPAAPPAR